MEREEVEDRKLYKEGYNTINLEYNEFGLSEKNQILHRGIFHGLGEITFQKFSNVEHTYQGEANN